MDSRKEFAIKVHEVIPGEPCVICHARTDPTGMDLFIADSRRPVCTDCGWKHAPQLTALLELVKGAEVFSAMSTPSRRDM